MYRTLVLGVVILAAGPAPVRAEPLPPGSRPQALACPQCLLSGTPRPGETVMLNPQPLPPAGGLGRLRR